MKFNIIANPQLVSLPPNAAGKNVEIFLGKIHRKQNLGAGGCNDDLRACENPPVDDDALALGMPLPKQGEYTVYGTDWCPHTRTVRMMLEKNPSVTGPFTYVEWDKFGGKTKVLDALKMWKDLPQDVNNQPVIFGTDGKYGGGRPWLMAKDGFYDEELGVYKTQDIKYDKNGNTVDVWYWSLEYSVSNTSWGLGTHRLTAAQDVSAMTINTEFEGKAELYALCQPPFKKPCEAWDPPYCGYETGLLRDSNQEQMISFPGYHHVRTFDSGDITDYTFSVSKGTVCYALLLTVRDKQLDLGW